MSARKLTYVVTSTVGASLQTLSAVPVICCDASQLIQGEQETGYLTKYIATEQVGRNRSCARL